MSEDNIQKIKVVSIDVPFGEIVSLTFQAMFASLFVALVVIAVPVGLFLFITQQEQILAFLNSL